MPECTGDICWEERDYFLTSSITNTQSVPTDGGPVLTGDLSDIMRGSQEWKDRVETRQTDPSGGNNKQAWNLVTFKKGCEPEADCRCRFTTRKRFQSTEEYTIDITHENAKYEIQFRAACWIWLKQGYCTGKVRRIVKYVDQPREQLLAMDIADVIEFVRPYLPSGASPGEASPLGVPIDPKPGGGKGEPV